MTCALLLVTAVQADDDDLANLLKNAVPATTTRAVLTDPSTQPVPTDALGTVKAKTPRESRPGTVTLSTGTKVEGRVWTTLATPLRVVLGDTDKATYQDMDWALIQQIDVLVDEAQLEDDWRWKKEGSDDKVFSGKKYPNVVLRYRITATNGKTVEGGVVAPIYINDGTKTRTLALYKKQKGELGETLKDVIYITSIKLTGPADTGTPETHTTQLPLLPD